MRMFNKIKEFFKEKDDYKQKIKRRLSIEQIYLEINKKIADNVVEDEKLKSNIIHEIKLFSDKLFNFIEILRNINLDKRKEHEKIKIIVLENLVLYINNLEWLINSLNKINEDNSEKIINKILNTLDIFSRRTHIPFEKVTILIGKELEHIDKTIFELLKYIRNLSDEKKDFFEKDKLTRELKLLIEKLKENKLYEDNINFTISNLKNDLKKELEISNEIRKKIENIINSEDYKYDLSEKNKHKSYLDKINNDLILLRKKINFKLLAKHFHNDNKRNNIIKEYSGDLRSAIISDENFDIVNMVKEVQGIELKELTNLKKIIIESEKPFITKTDEKISKLNEILKEHEKNEKEIIENISNEIKKKDKLISKRKEIIDKIKNHIALIFDDVELIN